MIGEMPEQFQEESKRLMLDWLEVCEEVELHDYLEKHASPEYLEYHNEEASRIRELRDRGIMV